MCGRYAMPWQPDELRQSIQAMNLAVDDISTGKQKRLTSYNVSPGRYAPVYRYESDGAPTTTTTTTKHIEYMKWGLIPSFAKDHVSKGNTFNCNDDKLLMGSSPLWNKVRQHQRCVIFIQGYYEWHEKKTPYFVKRKDGKPTCLLGFWDKNVSQKDDPLLSYTIITTSAAQGMKWLHERMPVMIDPETDREIFDEWLDPSKPWSKHLEEAIKPFDDMRLEIYQVDSAVGNIRNDGPKLIKEFKGLQGFFNLSPKKAAVKDAVRYEPKYERQQPKRRLSEDEPKDGSKVPKTL